MMMKNGTRERLRKRGIKAQQQQEQQQASDSFHNLQVPCCRLVQECCSDMFPQNNDHEPSLLGSLLRRHLKQGSTSTATTSTKKKRKRKKKKQRQDAETTATTASAQQPAAAMPPQDTSPHQQDNEAATPLLTESQHSQDTSFLPILQQWLERTPETTSIPKNRDFFSFVKNLQQPCTIDLHPVQAACDSIACMACRQSALSYYHSIRNKVAIGPASVVASRSTTTLWTLHPGGALLQQDDEERAFDYIAMEEGELLIDDGNDDTAAILSLYNKEGERKLQTKTPLTQSQIEDCIRQLLLPCGLKELEEANVFELQDFDQVCQAVTIKEQESRNQLGTISATLSSFPPRLEQTNTTSDTFDVTSSSELQECDLELNQVVKDVIRHVQYMEHILSYPDSSAMAVMQSIHASLLEAVSTIVHAQMVHFAKLVDISQLSGSVPQLPIDARHRSSFRKLLEIKVDALQKCIVIMIHCHDQVYRSALCRWVLQGCNAFSCDPHDLLFLLTLQTETVIGGNIQPMRETFVQKCREFVDGIQQAYNGIPHDASDQVSTLLGKIATEENANEEGDTLLAYRQDALQFFGHVLQARYEYRCCRLVECEKALPVKLKRWIRGEPLLHDNDDQHCMGGGGKRRVSSIFVSLVYKWLVDRCNEWHAELTQNELLESMVDGETAAATTKSGRSKKSKKKKKAAHSENVLPREPDACHATSEATRETSDAPSAAVKENAAAASSDRSDQMDQEELLEGKENNENLPRKTAVSGEPKNGKKKNVQSSKDASTTATQVEDKKSSPSPKKGGPGTTQDEANTRKASPGRGAGDPHARSDKTPVRRKSKVDSDKETSPDQHAHKRGGAKDKKAASMETREDKTTKKSSPGRVSNKPSGKKELASSPSQSEKSKSSPRGSRTPSGGNTVNVGVVGSTGFQSAESFLMGRLMAELQAEKSART